LIGVEYDVYHGIVYFLPNFDYEKWYDKVDVGECIYVDWLWYCWWIHIC